MKAEPCAARCKRIPNALTLLRAAAATALFFVPVSSAPFLALYALCGLTDVADGRLARRLHAESAFGAALDSAADLLFALAVAVRFLPAAALPGWALACIAGVALLRLLSLCVCRARFGAFALLHTALNRAAGLTVFLCVPLYTLLPHTPLLIAACAVSGVSAVEELLLLLSMPYLDRDRRWLLPLSGARTPLRAACRPLRMGELAPPLFVYFDRYQEVTRCWRKRGCVWALEDVPFTEQWDGADYAALCACLSATLSAGGAVYGAFYKGMLVGFFSVENEPFGPEREYLQLSSLHVSRERRGQGLGRMLFLLAARSAKERGAKKLYISAHSSEESMAFYHAMGCVEAHHYNEKLAAAEPCDCQLEYALS